MQGILICFINYLQIDIGGCNLLGPAWVGGFGHAVLCILLITWLLLVTKGRFEGQGCRELC